MKIALGTAQFGLDYGVANSRGKVSHDEVREILDHALLHGINTLDTAISYGESEQRLGEIGVGGWQIISKLPAIPDNVADVEKWVNKSFQGSLKRLGTHKLKGLLLHRSQELLCSHGDALYEALVKLKERGDVEKIGVSIYSPWELDSLWSRFQFDLVQAPFNVIDRRIATSGWLARLFQSGVEVHTRSVFLQGLLLMGHTERPVKFSRWQPLWAQWEKWLEDEATSPLQACLNFALSQPEISRVVVGVDNLEHLKEILSTVPWLSVTPPACLFSQDEDLINPSRWSFL